MADDRGVIGEIALHRGAFALAFLAIFGLTFAFLASVGATPDPIEKAAQAQSSQEATAPDAPQDPVRVVAASINLDTTVSNPDSIEVSVLDRALLSGAVRYPTSARLGVSGTMLLFGHSSYLPIVHNRAYKTFDGIQDLKTGDVISVYSDSLEYRYAVVGVKKADATEDVIDLPQEGKHLTLVTCDSFSKKTSRFVVTADFVGAYALGNWFRTGMSL